ncbi:MAG: CapA family protein, partial [Microcoleaceae cyanobacterium]
MVYVESRSQPSILDLARDGNFQALSYWINSFLGPEGISARVEEAHAGCLQILVEFQRELTKDILLAAPLRDAIVRFICHQLWKLNSPVFEGVRIKARLAGTPDILWNQSVRLVTPANRDRRRSSNLSPNQWGDWLKFKTLRTLLFMGSSIASFVIGSWVTYHEAIALQQSQTPFSGGYSAMVSQTLKESDTVKGALETVPVIKHSQVINPNDPTVTLLFGGDISLSNTLKDIVNKDSELPLGKLPEYRQADLAMVNLEYPQENRDNALTNKASQEKDSEATIKMLTTSGVDLVNLSNNPINQKWEPGLVDTWERVKKAGIITVGVGKNMQEARRPQIIEVKGKRIAYLGYSEADLRAGQPLEKADHGLYRERIAQDIEAIRNQVDWVVINFHWGVELANYPADWQIDLARFSIDKGADLIVGHHSQMLQGAEIYKGRPIVYSLGNFIFGNSQKDTETAVLKVSLKDRKMKVEFLPVVIKDSQPKLVQGEQGEKILKQIRQISSIFDQPMHSPVILESPFAARKIEKEEVPPVQMPLQLKNPQSEDHEKPSSSPMVSPTTKMPSLPNLPKHPSNTPLFGQPLVSPTPSQGFASPSVSAPLPPASGEFPPSQPARGESQPPLPPASGEFPPSQPPARGESQPPLPPASGEFLKKTEKKIETKAETETKTETKGETDPFMKEPFIKDP